MTTIFQADADNATPLDLVTTDSLKTYIEHQNDALNAQAASVGFKGAAGKLLLVHGPDGKLKRAVGGLGAGTDPFASAALPANLPPGTYRLGALPEGVDAGVVALAFADGAYRFERYKPSKTQPASLVLPDIADADDIERQAQAIAFLRDLINTPACDLGPTEIKDAMLALGEEFGAKVSVTEGDDLEKGYPLVAAVGRAATDKPKYVELVWGEENAPVLALVGKGVAFDTGGLNIKTGNYMALMKKDMGGAAHAMALARLVMGAKLNVRLVLCIPTVENAVGAGAFRPGDVLTSRKGLSVEIMDTDAEGRLILADALTRASEHNPELVIDYATLTGAARVAMGPDLAPIFTHDDELANAILTKADEVKDPTWRMPLWEGYKSDIDSSIADVKNLGNGPMGGSITAALFLEKFVDAPSWVHLDVWGWRPARYGRPAAAAANGLRSVWAALKAKYA